MRLLSFAVAAALSCVASLGQAAGLRQLEVPAGADGPALKVTLWSPCAQPAETVQLGPFALPAVRDCPISGKGLPLVVVSHGFGGTSLSHHDTAQALADAGFVVAALDHPDDTASNRERGRGLSALTSRPVDIKRLIDYMIGPSAAESHVDQRRIVFFGFSRGGYTGLVLAGAEPDFRELRGRCQDATGVSCPRIPPELAPTGPLQRDPRIGAYVIADPLSSVFPAAANLGAVTAPMLLVGSERGGDGVSPAGLTGIALNLPGKPEAHIVPGSGHFAFLTVCPAALIKTLPELCADAPGFDRAAFHKDLNSRIVEFFRKQLGGT